MLSPVKINKCLASKLLNAPFDNFLFQTIFPVQFLITCTGNTLTIMVLLSSQMRNRANHLLAALAAADMAVFLVMLPSCLASYSLFYNNNTFRSMLGTIKIQTGAMANWFSCCAIWFALAISIERVLIIKFPFRSLRPYRMRSTLVVVILSLVITFLLTHHHSVSRTCILMEMCQNGSRYTEIYALCLPRSFENWSLYDPTWKKPSKTFELYIDVGTICNAVFGVICPVFLVAVLNILLIHLHNKSKHETRVATMSTKRLAQIQEKKLTKTVVTIITCFTITNIPSAFVFLYETFFYDPSTQLTATAAFSKVASVTNFLVFTGKTINIVLLCLSSSAFRQRCKETIRCCFTMGATGRVNGSSLTKVTRLMSTLRKASFTTVILPPNAQLNQGRISEYVPMLEVHTRGRYV